MSLDPITEDRLNKAEATVELLRPFLPFRYFQRDFNGEPSIIRGSHPSGLGIIVAEVNPNASVDLPEEVVGDFVVGAPDLILDLVSQVRHMSREIDRLTTQNESLSARLLEAKDDAIRTLKVFGGASRGEK